MVQKNSDAFVSLSETDLEDAHATERINSDDFISFSETDLEDGVLRITIPLETPRLLTKEQKTKVIMYHLESLIQTAL